MPKTKTAIEDFAQWAQGREGLDPDVVDTIVEVKQSCLDDKPDTHWTRDGLRALLLEWLPRQVGADDQWVGATVPTMRAYIRFLRDTGRLHREADSAGTLLEELDALEPEYPTAMQDRSRFGMAKSLAALAVDDGVDLTDEAAVGEWTQRFAARVFGALEGADAFTSDGAYLDEDDGPPASVPAVRLPSREVLAEAARSSPLVTDVGRMAAWVGHRRQLTQTGVLRLDDAWAAVDELALLADVMDRDGESAADLRRRIRSARDIRALQMLWAVTVESGFVSLSRTTAGQGPAMRQWVDGDDEDVLEAWRCVFEAVTEMGVDYGLERRYQPPLFEQVEEAVLGAFHAMYVGGRTSVEDIVADMAGELGVPGASYGEPLKSWVEGEVRDFVERLVAVGALVWDDGEVAMTPLGRWVVRELLLEAGTDAPVVGDVRLMDAAQLLAETGRLWPEEADRARREWLDARAPAEAARDLVKVACEGRALERIAVVAILQTDLPDAAAEAALTSVVEHELFGPHARTWLAAHNGAEADKRPPRADECRLMLDAVASLLQALPPGSSTRDLPDDVWQFMEVCLPAPGEAPLRDDDAIQVYDAIGLAHPRGRVRKAAKKAAHQARRRALAPV